LLAAAHIGSTMGSLSDFREVMEQIFRVDIVLVVDSVYPLVRAREAYARLNAVSSLERSFLGWLSKTILR
jgi:D-arabinose 1-dehydrogenase-like Zn-dependent alcohol dehydrogenase